MIYIRELFKQDLRNGKQIAFPKEPSLDFFEFDYPNSPEDRSVEFTYSSRFDIFPDFDGKKISTRLYAAGSESRIDGQLKAFLRDEFHAEVGDLVIFYRSERNNFEYEFSFLPQSSEIYQGIDLLLDGKKHLVSEVNTKKNSPLTQPDKDSDKELSYQQIFYGAPGTGKSYAIDKMADPNRTIRTTFHPDSDYASFVGAYKPTMARVPIVAFDGTRVTNAKGVDGHDGREQKIVYKYVPQSFLKAYVAAWSDLSQPYYLVIEEINRGNCAQIFGDLFQLLDRNNMGSSSYAIAADEDITQFLATDENGFANIPDSAKDAIRSFILTKDDGRTINIGDDILKGKKLLLPPNLYIWATMNTSDQSLFPIDSAFKRRWNWKYVPIAYDKENWSFEIGNNRYSWGEFLRTINPIISKLTDSQDKQMGYYFAKPDKNSAISTERKDVISEDVFLNKVLFYIWTDVLKDFDAGEDPFLNSNTSRAYEFSDFFDEENDYLQEFIDKLDLENLAEYEADEENEYSLSVQWPNGDIISLPSKNDTYVEAIKRIGIDLAAEGTEGRHRLGEPIISKTKSRKIEDSKQYSYVQIGEYYVMVGIDNHGSVLRLLSNKYNLGLDVKGE